MSLERTRTSSATHGNGHSLHDGKGIETIDTIEIYKQPTLEESYECYMVDLRCNSKLPRLAPLPR